MRRGSFFELARTGFDAVLLDIEHSPAHFLDQNNETFYGAEGWRAVRKQLKPDGAFALWSNEAPDKNFVAHLNSVFGTAIAEIVRREMELEISAERQIAAIQLAAHQPAVRAAERNPPCRL